MARLSIALPETFLFSTEIDVRVTDLNYGRHLGNDAMLSLIHEARVRFLRARDMSEGDIDGTALILADVAICYRAEVFAGDRLRFDIALGDFARVSCDMLYRVTRVEDNVRAAEAKTGLVFLDPDTRRPTAVPDSLRS